MRALEWQTCSAPFTLRVRGKQWYWVYKFDLKNFKTIEELPVIIGRNKVVYPTKNTIEYDNQSLEKFSSPKLLAEGRNGILTKINKFVNRDSLKNSNLFKLIIGRGSYTYTTATTNGCTYSKIAKNLQNIIGFDKGVDRYLAITMKSNTSRHELSTTDHLRGKVSYVDIFGFGSFWASHKSQTDSCAKLTKLLKRALLEDGLLLIRRPQVIKNKILLKVTKRDVNYVKNSIFGVYNRPTVFGQPTLLTSMGLEINYAHANMHKHFFNEIVRLTRTSFTQSNIILEHITHCILTKLPAEYYVRTHPLDTIILLLRTMNNPEICPNGPKLTNELILYHMNRTSNFDRLVMHRDL